LIKIVAGNGTTGWGECQAPLLAETTQSVVKSLFGPYLIGRNPLSHERIYRELYEMMVVRGHGSSFIHDAIAGIDMALWDLKGKHYQAPVSEILGGPFRDRLPCYVSGLMQETLEFRAQAAKRYRSEGYSGVKMFLGNDPEQDLQAVAAVREAVGPGYPIYVDWMWNYSLADAKSYGKKAAELGVKWIEAPLSTYDVPSHSALAAALDVPIAIGEPLRTVDEFRPWFAGQAIGVAQPDILRAGITSTWKIANLAAAHHVPAALHLGVSTGIGLAATWNVAAALPNFLIQELQLDLFANQMKVLKTPLTIECGHLCVPQSCGLGVEVDESYVEAHTTEHWLVDEAGIRRAG
jgi:L-alanine-DL-glutamate epimerase-like enolase superfamily enzyme